MQQQQAKQDYKGEALHYAVPQDGSVHNQPLKYYIHGRPAFASVTVNLESSEDQVIGDGGSFLWCDGDVDVTATCPGGCWAANRRKWSGESCIMEKFTGPGTVTLSFDAPGDILPFVVTPEHGWVITQKAFIGSTTNVKVSSRFAGCCASQYSGEGSFFTKITTKEPLGLFFAGGYGEIIRHEIPEEKTLIVDNGLFFAAHSKTSFKLRKIGGYKGCCTFANGEGLGMVFRGPAIVYTQSRDPALWDAATSPPPENATEDSSADFEVEPVPE